MIYDFLFPTKSNTTKVSLLLLAVRIIFGDVYKRQVSASVSSRKFGEINTASTFFSFIARQAS